MNKQLDLTNGNLLDDYSHFSMSAPLTMTPIKKKIGNFGAPITQSATLNPTILAPVANVPLPNIPLTPSGGAQAPVATPSPSTGQAPVTSPAPTSGGAVAPAPSGGDAGQQPQGAEQVKEQPQGDAGQEQVAEQVEEVQVVEQTDDAAPEQEEEASNATGSTPQTINVEIPMWAKMLPLVGLGVGIYFANKRKSGAGGYIGFGLLGLFAGSIPSTYIGITKGVSAMGSSLKADLEKSKSTPKPVSTPAVVVNVNTPTTTTTATPVS